MFQPSLTRRCLGSAPAPPDIVALATAETFTQSSLTRRDVLCLFDPGLKRPGYIQASLCDEAELLNKADRLFGQSPCSWSLRLSTNRVRKSSTRPASE